MEITFDADRRESQERSESNRSPIAAAALYDHGSRNGSYRQFSGNVAGVEHREFAREVVGSAAAENAVYELVSMVL